MTDYKAKMHQIRFRLGLRPRPRWGDLTALPRPLAGFGAALQQGEGWAGEEEGRGGREGKWRKGKGRAPKLLLNRGPSEPCYATGDKNYELGKVDIFGSKVKKPSTVWYAVVVLVR